MAKAQEAHKSRLKMAQMCNCIGTNYPYRAKLIKNVLNKEDNINRVIPANVFQDSSERDLTECTILHIAAIKRDVEAFKILLDNGADFTMQNQQGCTVLHYLFECIADDSRNELINSVLSAHVKFANSSNPCNNNGISHFHIACMVNNTQAVQFFLENEASVHQIVKVDSPRFPGYSSLHFAAEGCSIETMKLLLKNDINMSSKDAQGRTALHIFLQQKIKLFDSLRESETDATKIILEKIDLMDDATNLLLQNDDIDDVGFSQFHSACTMQDSAMAEDLVRQVTDINHCVMFDSPVWPGYTGLHFAAHCNMKIFQMLVQKGATIEAKNAKGLTPLDIYCEKCKPQDLLTILRCKAEWVDSKFINDKTKLIKLIDAMCAEPLQFCSYLEVAVENINIQVVKNPPFWIGFTPLHFAVLISKDTDTEMVQMCLNRGAEVTIQDLHGQTPMHLAFRMKKLEVTILLINSCSSPQDWVLMDDEGLSLDHIVQQLIRHSLAYKLQRSLSVWYNGRDVFQDVKASWLHLAIYSGDCDCDALNRQLNIDSLIPSNVDAVITCNDPKIFWTRYRGYTPLHLAIERSSAVEVVEALLMNGADIFATRPDGMTPIYAVLKDISNDYLISQFLLQLEANYDFRRPERIPKQHLTELSGITMLHVACRTFNVEAVKNLIEDGINVDARVRRDCPIWSGCTPLHVLLCYSVYIQEQYIYEDFQEILGLLLTKGADVTAVNKEGNTPVHLSFQHCMNLINDYNFVCTSLLMDHHKIFTINPVNSEKISHFHAACIVNNVEAVEKFLNYGVDVNEPIDLFIKNFAGESSLHLALKRLLGNENHMRTVHLLLSHGADVLAEDSYGYTALHRAAYDYSANVELFEKLVTYGANVNAKSIFGETPMEFLLKVDEISQSAVNVLLNAGCQLNSCNHITEEGYLAMIVDNFYHKAPQSRIFRRMMEAPDLSNTDEMNRTALHNIVTTRKANFNIVNYADIIDQFEKLGINLDHQDRLGKTALHLAAQFRNTEATIALINAGADVNIIDLSDKTALSYALESCDPVDYHDGNVIKNLVAHLRKLQLFGIGVNQLNEYLLKKNNLNASFDYDGLLSERKKIKGNVVDTQPRLILDDFLSETKALTSYPFMIDSKRKKVKDVLKSITDKSIEFRSILMFQYRKTLKGVVV